MPAITTRSERTGRWTKMHRPFVPFSVPESSAHRRFSADCITTTSGFRFSVHTPLAFSADTSDKTSTLFLELLNNLNKISGQNFKGCDWQTSDQIEIDRFLRDPLNGKPFCNRMMYGVL